MTDQGQPPYENNKQDLVFYDAVSEKAILEKQLESSSEIDSIVSQIHVFDTSTIVSFGLEISKSVSEASDKILKVLNRNQPYNYNDLLNNLTLIMKKFDSKELKENQKENIFSKLFSSQKKSHDVILRKYDEMAVELDKVYIQLKQYEGFVQEINNNLDRLLQEQIYAYKLLVKYILSAQQGIKEIDEHLVNLKAQLVGSEDLEIQFDIKTVEQAKTLLEHRVHDLKTTEIVSLQTIPMIQNMKFSNLDLIRKINSAFLLTIPVFKQSLAQVIVRKRQEIQSQAMKNLGNQATNMIRNHSENTLLQERNYLDNKSNIISDKSNGLEESWEIIANGIEETNKMEKDAQKERLDNISKLNSLISSVR